MLKIFKGLFKEDEPVNVAELYNFIDVEFSEIEKYSSIMDDISAGTKGIDGIIIRNVFTKDEVASIKQDLSKVDDEGIRINEGLITIPKAFSQVDQASFSSDEKLKEIFLDVERIWKRFGNDFRVPLKERIYEALRSISGDREMVVPAGLDDVGHYTPATFKRMLPGEGSLVPHCGNYFHNEFPYLFNHLGQDSYIHDQMSFFITIQPAEEGGELVLYDVLWEEAEVRENHTVLHMKNGKTKDLENPKQTRTQPFKPNAGDLLCFAGGRIWHRVSYVKGNQQRITLGGFLSPSKDGTKTYFWS